MITLLVITDGRRRCLQRTLESFDLSVDPRHISRRVIVNDCPDAEFGEWVDTLGFDTVVPPLWQRRGYGGAITAGWDAIEDAEWVFHLEDDFVFTRHVDVAAMVNILRSHQYLAQMALRRQPWNDAEKAVGGIVEQHPEQYRDCTDGFHRWLEHRMFFTTNPCVYPRWVRKIAWPRCNYSEGVFSHLLFSDSNTRSAFWGQRSDPPWVIHIGHQRTGTGY